MKFCNKCGTKLSDNAKFCNKCGAKLSDNDKDNDNVINKNEAKNIKDTSLKIDDNIELENIEDSNTVFEEVSKTELDKENIKTEEIEDNTEKLENVENSNTVFEEVSKTELNKENIKEEITKTEEIEDNTEKLENVESSNPVFEEVSKTELNKKNIKEEIKEEIIKTEEIEEVFENPSEISEEPKKKAKKKALFIAVPIILLIIGIGTFLYFSKDDLLYNHYLNSAAEEHTTSEKLYDYNKALKYKYNNTVIDDIYNVLKDDAYFETEINSLSNLQNKDKANLIIKICLNNADKDCASKNYDSALKSLTLASKYGYKLKSYPKFDEIQKGLDGAKLSSEELDSKYTFKNNNPSSDPKDIYKYSGDYIIFNSDTDYITPGELSDYNKDSLALIRNEIYARHGYVFSQEPFKSYFNSKSWYHQNPSFKGNDSDLNEYEKANVDLIKKLENQ